MERVLRACAIAIAVLALFDPAITSRRRARPIVALIDASGASSTARTDGARASRELLDRTRQLLARDFTVVPAAFANASGTVVVGDRLPPLAAALAVPFFAVLPDTAGVRVRVERVQLPRTVSAVVPAMVHALLRTRGARGRALTVTLRSAGVLADRVERVVTTDDEYVEVDLTYTPTAVGTVSLAVTATISSTGFAATTAAETSLSASASAVTTVIDAPRSILVYDTRPSWMSTFVRRAIERDRRFSVTSRVNTSRRISTDAGRPPASFDDEEALATYEAIIVGAPEALTPREVAGLDRYLRRRGGSVLLLFDRASTGAYARLTGEVDWISSSTATTRTIVAADVQERADSIGMRVTKFMVPGSAIAGGRALALVRTAANDRDSARAVVWSVPVGAGQLVVSGALDAWRFRDPTVSAFERFWQRQVAAAAEAAPPRLLLETANRLVAPNEWVDVTVTLREAALASNEVSVATRAAVSATLQSGSSTIRERVRLWPAGPVGRFRGVFRAPLTEGHFLLTAESGGDTAIAPIVVSSAATAASASDEALLVAWASTRGGGVVSSTQLETLRSVVTSRLHPMARPVAWHPMRSAWWIVPFSFLLGAEWWLRRRSGRA